MQAPGQVQRGSGKGSEGSGEGLGGFGAEPGQVQQGSGESLRKGWEALVQSQVRFSSLAGFRRRFQNVPEKVQLRCFQRLASQFSGWLRSTLQKDL